MIYGWNERHFSMAPEFQTFRRRQVREKSEHRPHQRSRHAMDCRRRTPGNCLTSWFFILSVKLVDTQNIVYACICILYLYIYTYSYSFEPPLTLQTLEDDLALETSRCQAFNAPLPPGWTEHQVSDQLTVGGYPCWRSCLKQTEKGNYSQLQGEWGLTEWKYGICYFWSRIKVLQWGIRILIFWSESLPVKELFIGSFPSCNMQIRRDSKIKLNFHFKQECQHFE